MQEITEEQKDNTKESSLQGFASLCGTFAVGLFILTFVFQNFVIPSSSMASTLLVGDHVVVERATLARSAPWTPFIPYRELHRGEPVVFYKPVADPDGEHTILVKRVIGIPGDRIHLRRGIVYLNGVPRTSPSRLSRRMQTTIPIATTSLLSLRPVAPTSQLSGPSTSPATSRAKTSSSLRAVTSSWATTAPTV
jgi:signal peptidase I